MLEGEDSALCHPGCVHQPVSSLETPSLTLDLLVSPAPTSTWPGAEGKDCTSCPGRGEPLNTKSNLDRCQQWCIEGGVTLGKVDTNQTKESEAYG